MAMARMACSRTVNSMVWAARSKDPPAAAAAGPSLLKAWAATPEPGRCRLPVAGGTSRR